MAGQSSSAAAPNKKYTTLYAGDDEENRDQNHKFIVQRHVATSASRTIKDMFDEGRFEETERNAAWLQSIKWALHLDKCCEYWYFNYANKENPSPEEFKFPVEMALELLITADFLDCKHILDRGSLA